VIVHLDLRREGKLVLPQMVLELFQEWDDILFHGFLAVLDVGRSLSCIVSRDARLSVLFDGGDRDLCGKLFRKFLGIHIFLPCNLKWLLRPTGAATVFSWRPSGRNNGPQTAAALLKFRCMVMLASWAVREASACHSIAISIQADGVAAAVAPFANRLQASALRRYSEISIIAMLEQHALRHR
jgi:hypothetical protein